MAHSASASQHPFGVEASCEKRRDKSQHAALTGERTNIGDDTKGVEENSGKKWVGYLKVYKKDICFSVLLVISAGAIAGLAGYSLKIGLQISSLEAQIDKLEEQKNAPVANNGALENKLSKLEAEHVEINNQIGAVVNQSDTHVAQTDRLESALYEIENELNRHTHDFVNKTDILGSKIDVLETALSEIGNKLASVNAEMAALGNQSNTHSAKLDVHETSLSEIGDGLKNISRQINALWNQTDVHGSKMIVLETALFHRGRTLTVESTTTNDNSGTTATLSPPQPPSTLTSTVSTTAPESAFQVLKTGETVYQNYSFLALQVRVPYDGLSTSENWCRDYENLCKHFGRRPTGCGVSFITAVTYKDCATLYNSDMNIGDAVLGCSPASGVASLINTAFPGWSPMASRINSFGFYQCKEENCEKTIKESDYWVHNKTVMYTVCR